MEQIKKIHNAVFVSDRIITYKSAAAILEIDVNEAKNALKKYVKDVTNKDEIINVSYVLGGVTLADQHKVRIVPQNKYEKAKASFKTVTIDHIYSIQKSPLVDWSPIFNVDDFLYDKNDAPTERTIKQEIVEIPEVKKEIKTAQATNKKGALSNFLNNTNQKKSSANQKSTKAVATKEENESKSKKPDKNSVFTNYFSKTSNKENVTKVNTTVKKEEVVSDDEDEIFKVTKKRSRVLNDDDDDDDAAPTKQLKTDILDDPMEEDNNEEDFHSDEDIFGSPEKDEELMKDSEEFTEKETQNSFHDINTETTEDTTETTEQNTKSTEENTENSETMYEDEDGYFVTEKKKPGPKSQSVKKGDKKDVVQNKKVEKEEKKSKKETVKKIQNNTNQKSILSFFQKK